MAFKVLFLAHAPDGEPEKHRCIIETDKYYKLLVVLVNNQEQAIQVCKEAVEKEGIQSILFCPGFTHREIAEISEAVGENVGISVARGDGPSSRIALKAMTSEGWFSEKGRD
jgi:biotin synthase-related radical SAM superfamily protein